MSPLADVLICLRFFSRLPVPSTARERALGAGGLAQAAAAAPVAGVILAAVPVAIVLAAVFAHLPFTVAAPLAIAGLVAATGALHEDALADCADGLGGRTRERRLEIMRDSRIGAFGAAAIALSLLLRSSALLGALDRNEGVAALVLSAGLSRAACLMPLVLLPPARADGLGAAAAQPDRRSLFGAGALSLALLTLAVLAGIGAERAVLAFVAAASAGLAASALAWRRIGGQTGDVAGAAQQLAETGVLMVFAAGS